MIDNDLLLRLQACLDGEASANQARSVEALLTEDVQARALSAELQNTRLALAAFRLTEAEVKLPEAREFFWSKIEREIQRQQRPEPVPNPSPLWAAWRRWLVYSGAAAGLVVAALLIPRTQHATSEFEAAVSDTGAFTYRDFKANTTLVWLSFPADKELADNDETSTSD